MTKHKSVPSSYNKTRTSDIRRIDCLTIVTTVTVTHLALDSTAHGPLLPTKYKSLFQALRGL